MKQFFSLVIVTILLASQMRATIIIVNYYLNREAITQEFCVNLDKGITSCQGKCHLKRTLGDEESKKTNGPQIIVEKRGPLFYQVLDLTYVSQLVIVDDVNVHYMPIYDFLYIDTTFHPPEGISS